MDNRVLAGNTYYKLKNKNLKIKAGKLLTNTNDS